MHHPRSDGTGENARLWRRRRGKLVKAAHVGGDRYDIILRCLPSRYRGTDLAVAQGSLMFTAAGRVSGLLFFHLQFFFHFGLVMTWASILFRDPAEAFALFSY